MEQNSQVEKAESLDPIRVSFKIPIETFSINAMYYNDGRIKTSEARAWTVRLCEELSKFESELAKIRDNFNEKEHGLVLDLTAFYPKEKIMKEEGGLSSRAHDISNWEKPLIDILFLPKYFNLKPPKGFKNLNMDDKFNLETRSRKLPSPIDGFTIQIKIEIVLLTDYLCKSEY